MGGAHARRSTGCHHSLRHTRQNPQHVLRCPLSNKLDGVIDLFRASQKDQDIACNIGTRSVSQGSLEFATQEISSFVPGGSVLWMLITVSMAACT